MSDSMWDMNRFAIDHLQLLDDTPRTQYKVQCVYHDDHTPSMTLFHDGRYRCYVCKVGGGIMQLVKDMFGIDDDLDVLDFLYPYVAVGEGDVSCRICGGAQTTGDTQRYENDLLLAEDIVEGFTRKGITSDWERPISPSQHYLFSRGFTAETLSRYNVVVSEVMHNYPVIIPLFFDDGIKQSVYGFMNRTTTSDVYPKYLTMAGLAKQQHLYGIAHKYDTILVTEGRPDGMMAWQYTGCSEVSILGSIVSDAQAKLLADLHPYALISGFDTDSPGDRAHLQLQEKMSEYDIPVFRLQVPRHDIASSGRVEFVSAWEEVCDASRLYINMTQKIAV